MIFYDGGPLFHPYEEPQYIIDGKRLNMEAAKREIAQRFGYDVEVTWLNMTSIEDNCDVFVMGLCEHR